MEFVHMLSFVERTLGAFADATREELNARAPALLTSAHPRPVSCRLLCANNIFSLHWSRILSLPAFAAAKFNRRHSRRRLRLRRRASSADQSPPPPSSSPPFYLIRRRRSALTSISMLPCKPSASLSLAPFRFWLRLSMYAHLLYLLYSALRIPSTPARRKQKTKQNKTKQKVTKCP